RGRARRAPARRHAADPGGHRAGAPGPEGHPVIWSWGSFGIGLATLPALALAFLLVQALVVELFLRRQESIGCGHCDWELDEKPRRWIGHRRRTLHVMRNHPRASATFLRVHATGELPFKIARRAVAAQDAAGVKATPLSLWTDALALLPGRSEEHTSELQSRFDLVCR